MATPAWQEERGAALRGNRNRVNTSPSVTKLFDLTCTTMDFNYFLEHKEEFDTIPDLLIAEMLALPDCKLNSPEYFHLLVKPGRSSIHIPCYPLPGEEIEWTTEHVNTALDIIKNTCPPGSLKTFGIGKPYSPYLENCSGRNHKVDRTPEEEWRLYAKPDPERLNAILREQPGLQKIELDPCVTTNEDIFGIIRQTCHDLRSLKMEHYYGPTLGLDGMRELAEDWPLLQKFDVTDSVDYEYEIYLPQYFKNITHCLVDDDILNTFHQSGGILPPLLRPNLFLSHQSDNYYTLINNLCPNVSSVEIMEHDADLSRYEFKSVKKLFLSQVERKNIPQIEPFLKKCGSDIVRLYFDGYNLLPEKDGVVDLSAVVKHCPKLVTIDIQGIPISQSCEYSMTPEKVKYLRCLYTSNIPDEYVCCTPPDDFVYSVSCNGVLEHLDVPTLSPRLLTRLTEEMQAAAANSRPSPVFPKLTHLVVDKVGQENMTLAQAVDLVTLAPRLRKVRFISLTQQDKDQLQIFLAHFAPQARLL